MTDQELLQQAKDQVAKAWILEKMGYTYTGEKPWELVLMRYYEGDVPSVYYDEAALLAIQSAREEATLKDAIKILNRIAPTATPKEYKYLSEAVAALELIRDGHLRN